MRILSIQIKNFKRFKDLSVPDWDGELPEGLILIKGPNSTGKSTLFEAILWGLWGPDAVEATNEDVVNFTSTHCEVNIVFEVEKMVYKMQRQFDKADRMSVTLFFRKGTAWKRLAHKISEVKDKLNEILNLDIKQALDTLLVRQGEVARIALARPAELRKLLGEIYNIEFVRLMTNQLEYLESELGNRIAALDSDYVRPEHIEDEIRRTRAKMESIEETLKKKEAKIEELGTQLEGLPALERLSAIRDIESEVDDRRTELEHATRARDQYLEEAGLAGADERIISKRLSSLEKETDKLQAEREDIKDKVSEIDREVGSISGMSSDLQKKVDTLQIDNASSESDQTECPTCSKPLSLDERDQIIRDYKSKIGGSKARKKELTTKRATLMGESKQIESRLRSIDTIMRAVQRIGTKQGEVDSAKAKMEQCESRLIEAVQQTGEEDLKALLAKYKVKTLVELEKLVLKLSKDHEGEQRAIDSDKEAIEERNQEIEDYIKKVTKMKEIEAEISDTKSLLTHTQYVRRKLVSGFLADYVIQKRLIGIIRGATNEYVRAFTNGQYSSIDLVSKAATGRSGAGLVLQVRDDRDSATKKSSQLSFGDRTAISLALRLGISRTMSSIRPMKESPAVSPRVRCVMLDEPLAGLDKSRRLEVVRNLINDQSFRQIFLITHTDVQDWDGVSVIDVQASGSTSTAILTVDSGA